MLKERFVGEEDIITASLHDFKREINYIQLIKPVISTTIMGHILMFFKYWNSEKGKRNMCTISLSTT